MEKIFKSLNSINNFSKKIIIYGSGIVLTFCALGALIILYNNMVLQEVAVYEFAKNLIQTFSVVFAQVVIGALIMDWFNTMQNN